MAFLRIQQDRTMEYATGSEKKMYKRSTESKKLFEQLYL